VCERGSTTLRRLLFDLLLFAGVGCILLRQRCLSSCISVQLELNIDARTETKEILSSEQKSKHMYLPKATCKHLPYCFEGFLKNIFVSNGFILISVSFAEQIPKMQQN